jgi:phosphatidate cytidylyltransferase
MEQTPQPVEGRYGNRNWEELAPRVFSALVLGAFSLLAAYAGSWCFAVLIALFITGMAWEWGRLVRGAEFDGAFAAQSLAMMLAVVLSVRGQPIAALLAVTVGAAFVLALEKVRRRGALAWWSAGGVYYTGTPAVGLIWLRSDEYAGFEAILYLFIVVWTTDTAAYFSGRLIGGPKLAPWISPKKTWAGLVGGAVSAACAGGVYAAASVGSSVGAACVVSLALALVSQFGDLSESALKRFFGTKDASGLIPGHGGVLDRLDGLVSAAAVAAMIALIRGPDHPGRALLLWSS